MEEAKVLDQVPTPIAAGILAVNNQGNAVELARSIQ